MHISQSLLLGLTATFISVYATDDGGYFAVLLKRQAPGTPAYNCHDNCGQAVIQARETDDVCNDKAFLSNYKNCLQCAGPDNVAIWQYYGDTLSEAAEKCNLDTEPVGGKQDDVGPAIPADSGASSSSISATSSLGAQPTGGGSGVSTSDSGKESASPTPTSPPEIDAAGRLAAIVSGGLVAVACAVAILT